MAGYETVLEALEERDLIRGGWGEAKSAICPAHEDNRPSLSLKEGDNGNALVFCHAGCPIEAVVEALDLKMVDLFGGSQAAPIVDQYLYPDEEGHPHIRVQRTSNKEFYGQRWEDGEWKYGLKNTRRVLYRLPELVASTETVWITEGEKDADALLRAGVPVVTTLLGGAGKWRDEYLPFFKDREVVIVGDNDDPGRLHVETLSSRLSGTATSVTALYPASGKDVSDHLAAGLSLDALVAENDGLDEFGPLDWDKYETPDTDWLLEPYVPRGGRVLAFGPAGSLKSLWAMWVAAHLAREGKKVAYFSLEMLPSDTARRVRSLAPPKDNFLLFTRDLRLGSPSHTEKLIAGLKGYDLIVIDSWTAARHNERDSNEAVSALDNEVFLPLIRLTGATLLILDNTGHDAVTDKGKVVADHARGASAKGDKMEVTLFFRRPAEENNYRTKLTVKKMRLDYPTPAPLVMETPQDRIEFYVCDGDRGMVTGTPCWTSLKVEPFDDVGGEPPVLTTTGKSSTDAAVPPPQLEDMTVSEKLALARLKDSFGAKDII